MVAGDNAIAPDTDAGQNCKPLGLPGLRLSCWLGRRALRLRRSGVGVGLRTETIHAQAKANLEDDGRK